MSSWICAAASRARNVLVVSVLLISSAGLSAHAATSLERGEYLVNIMDCTGCHTYGAMAGKPDPARWLAGSDIGFEIPGLGVFYPRNLTSDRETGLGTWSEADIIMAIRHGVRPDGRELAPVMPWPSYGYLSDEDAAAVAAYLKSLPPVQFKAPGPYAPGETPAAPYFTVVLPK